MKYILGTIFLIFGLGSSIWLIISFASANYNYENQYSSFWSLADKTSTIDKKSDYINQFVSVLDAGNMHGCNNALIYKTSDNSFDKNLDALKSLQDRLNNIKKMDENSLAYQNAIQQITAQEQGEAKDMLAVFSRCWYKQNHYFLWNFWILLGEIIGIVIFYIAAFVSYFWEN